MSKYRIISSSFPQGCGELPTARLPVFTGQNARLPSRFPAVLIADEEPAGGDGDPTEGQRYQYPIQDPPDEEQGISLITPQYPVDDHETEDDRGHRRRVQGVSVPPSLLLQAERRDRVSRRQRYECPEERHTVDQATRGRLCARGRPLEDPRGNEGEPGTEGRRNVDQRRP